MVIGASPDALYQLVSLVRKETSLPLWIKLTPNVTDITQTALAAQKAGADAVVAINTLMGMAIDVKTAVRYCTIIPADSRDLVLSLLASNGTIMCICS